jgi:hypothetical protein
VIRTEAAAGNVETSKKRCRLDGGKTDKKKQTRQMSGINENPRRDSQ